MLHQLLNLTRPLFVLDTETTGVDAENDRILELGFQEWNADGLLREWRTFINPLVSIPAHAAAVHGVDDAFIKSACRHCQKVHDEPADHDHALLPTFRQLALSFAKGFSNCDFGGQNVRFDLRIMAKEFQRAGIEWNYEGARIVDSYALEARLYPRDLSSLHEKYVRTTCEHCHGTGTNPHGGACSDCRGVGTIGRKHDGAHGALSDVRASALVIGAQLRDHERLPRDLDALHALQWPGFIDSEGRFRFIDGVACCTFGKWKGRPMTDIDRSYYDWLIVSGFSSEVKSLAADAKLGKFPVLKS